MTIVANYHHVTAVIFFYYKNKNGRCAGGFKNPIEPRRCVPISIL